MDLYLVRHGESHIPADTVQLDYPLSPLGEEQAARLGERFRGMTIDHLITTPYRRTQQTAAAIATTTNVTVLEEPGLGAIDAGELTRIPFSQRRERWPEYYARPVSPLMDYAYFGGESAASFYERVTGAFIERIWDRFWQEPATVVVVCHAETVNALLHHILAMPYEGWIMFTIDHTAVSMLDVRHNRPRVRYVNDTTHLGNLPRGHSGRFGGEVPRGRTR
jgi:broad specificity phosphatase PhoE